MCTAVNVNVVRLSALPLLAMPLEIGSAKRVGQGRWMGLPTGDWVIPGTAGVTGIWIVPG